MLVKKSSCKVCVKSYCRKTVSEKNLLFWQFLPPGGKTVEGLSNELFRGAVALLVSELCVDLLKIIDIWPTNRRILAFDDLWWPDLWPDQKIDRSDFFLIFDALSNAAFSVSLRCPGTDLEGGVQTPPSRTWKSRTPSGARVNMLYYSSFFFLSESSALFFQWIHQPSCRATEDRAIRSWFHAGM